MSELPLQLEDQVQDPEPDRDVEHRDRLVGEDHLRLDRERARDRDALALAAGELVRVLLRDVRRHEPDRSSSSRTRASTWSRGTMPWIRSGRSMWCATRLDGIERPEGVLEDHLHLRAVVSSSCGAADRATSSPSNRIVPAVGS